MREDWRTVKLESVFQLSNKKLGAHATEPPVFAVSKYDGVVLASEFFEKRVASSSLDGYKLVDSNDWVYSTIHIDEGSISRNHFSYAGVVSPMYTTMRWTGSDHLASYFELLLKSDLAIRAYRDSAQGTVNRRRSLSWGTFSKLEFVVPSTREQKRIVDLMSSVDSYIAALQQQAAAARVARSAVLSELLSAGRDDWTETTPSVRRLEDVAFLQRGHDLPSQARTDGDFPVIASNGKVGLHNECIGPVPGVVTGRSGTIGKVIYLEVGYWPLNTTLYVTDFKGNDEKFVALTLEILHLERFAGGTTVPSLDRKVLRRELVFAPDVVEQKRIVEIVSSIDEVIQSADKAVADAKKLRSGLLSDLLSGSHEIPESYDRLLGAA